MARDPSVLGSTAVTQTASQTCTVSILESTCCIVTLVCSASERNTSALAESSRRKCPIVSLSRHMSRTARAVFAVSLREWTKINTYTNTKYTTLHQYAHKHSGVQNTLARMKQKLQENSVRVLENTDRPTDL